MDENMIFRNKNRNYEDKWDRMLDNYAEMTASKMKTYDQFRQQQFREQQEDNGFTLIEEQKDEFYSTDRVKENVLMIDELMDHAEALQLTGAQKEDLNIRRNRIKDFELLNDKTKEDSDKMTRVKEEIRQYDKLLSMAPKSLEEYQTFCMLAKEKCEDVIQSCNEYLKRGKSLKFWRSDRDDRFHMVEEAKERFLKDQDIFSTLSELTDTEKFLRPDDTMLDLMNLEAINERLVAYDAAQRQEQEEDQLLEEELKRMEEELDDQEEGYKQAEGVNDLFTAEEKRLQREEKRQAGENQAENVGEFFADAGEEYQEQKKEEEYEYEEGDSFEEIPAEEQEQYQEQKKEEEYEYEEGDSFEEIPAEEQEQYQKEHQAEAERQRQAEEERQHKEAEERKVLDDQAQGFNEFFANVEEQKRKEEEREALYDQAQGVNELFANAEEYQQQEEHQEEQQQRHEEQNKHQNEQQQQQEQQQELYGTKALDELKKQAETPEMQAIKTAITDIQTQMAKEMPAVQVMENKEQEKKAERRARKGLAGVDALSVKMVRLFGALDLRIAKCLNKENGAGYGNIPALKTLLENLREQTKVDRAQFKDKVVQYRSYIAGNAEEAVKKHTWFDAWKYVRSVSYDLDEKNNGLETKTTGAGASMITVIKDTKKNQTVYFRQGENAGGFNTAELVKTFMESIKGEAQLDDDVKEKLKEAFASLFNQNILDFIKEGFDEGDERKIEEGVNGLEYPGVSNYRTTDVRYNIDEFVQTATCPRILKDAYQNADEVVKTEIGKAFTLFAKKHFQYTFSAGVAGINPEQSLTDRNVATSRLAGLLGISSMISDSRTAVIKKDGKEVMGNVMENSRGKTSRRMKGDWTYSDKAIGQVYTLQVFDMICGQIDRHEVNFHFIEKNGNANSVKAIDNDMSFGRLTWNKIASGHQNISPLTECHVRAMPIAVINQILSLNEDILKEALGDVLDSVSIDYLMDRLSGVQRTIIEYAKKDESGLKIGEDGKTAEFEGEDADDTLRMLKAVKEQSRHPYRHIRIDGGVTELDNNQIVWDHLKENTLDEKITKARTAWQNKQKKEQENNQA